jgi:hypothetical protein
MFIVYRKAGFWRGGPMAEEIADDGQSKKREPNSGSFVKGDPRIPGVRKRLLAEGLLVEDPPGEPASLYDDMRLVRHMPASADRTVGQ